MYPVVSIVVPTYNRKEMLGETIRSILAQTFADFELIVVDNESNYDFEGFIRSFSDSRIRAYRNNNGGVISVNRNFGIRQAKGTYLAFCDDDDLWLPEKLEKQVQYLQESGCDLVSSNMLMFEENIENTTGASKNRLVKNVADFMTGNQIITSTVVTRKSELVQFNEDPALVSIEDYTLWLNLYLNGYKFGFLNQNLIQYRIHNANATNDNWMLIHLRLIYLHISVYLNHHNKVSFQSVIRSVLVNLSKAVVKKIMAALKKAK